MQALLLLETDKFVCIASNVCLCRLIIHQLASVATAACQQSVYLHKHTYRQASQRVHGNSDYHIYSFFTHLIKNPLYR